MEVKTIKVKKGVWRTYDATDGLPGDPYHLHQDKWGYLWIGTREGLCRYDGREFITYTPADGLDDKMIQAFCEDSQGRLWIGTKKGLSCFDGKQLIHCALTDKMAGKNVKSLCIDNQDKLWIGTVYRNGLFSFDGDSLVNYSTDAGLPDNQI